MVEKTAVDHVEIHWTKIMRLGNHCVVQYKTSTNRSSVFFYAFTAYK